MKISIEDIQDIISEEIESSIIKEFDASNIVDFFRVGKQKKIPSEPVEPVEPDLKAFICKYLKGESGTEIASDDTFLKDLEGFPKEKHEEIVDLFNDLSGNAEKAREFCGDPSPKSGVVRVFGVANKRSLEFKIVRLLKKYKPEIKMGDAADLALQLSKDIATQLIFNKVKVRMPSGKLLEVAVQVDNPEQRKIIYKANILNQKQTETEKRIQALKNSVTPTGKKFNRKNFSPEQVQQFQELSQRLEKIKQMKDKIRDQVTQAQRRTLPAGRKTRDGKIQSFAGEKTRQQARPELGKLKVSIPLFTRLRTAGYDQKQISMLRKDLFQIIRDMFEKSGTELQILEQKRSENGRQSRTTRGTTKKE